MQFTDKQGATWNLSLPIGLARSLRGLPEPIDILDPECLQSTVDDLFKRFDMLVAICTGQMKEQGITPEQFDVRLAETSVFEEASQALRLALTDFFRRAGRPDLARIMDRIVEAADRLRVIAANRVDSPKVNAAIEKAIVDAEAEMEAKIDEALLKLNPIPVNPIPGTKSNS